MKTHQDFDKEVAKERGGEGEVFNKSNSGNLQDLTLRGWKCVWQTILSMRAFGSLSSALQLLWRLVVARQRDWQ